MCSWDVMKGKGLVNKKRGIEFKDGNVVVSVLERVEGKDTT